MVFVNSMSDLFQAEVPENYIVAVIEVMEKASWHTYQVLTKRAERMREVLCGVFSGKAVPDNVWLGVSVEDRKHGLPRIDELRQTPAATRFLSVEPLLEDLGEFDLTGIDWVIVGGESGAGARPMEEAWVRHIRGQCAKAKVPFFFKQWGGVRKFHTGRLLDGKTYDEFPERSVGQVMELRERMALVKKLEAAHY